MSQDVVVPPATEIIPTTEKSDDKLEIEKEEMERIKSATSSEDVNEKEAEGEEKGDEEKDGMPDGKETAEGGDKKKFKLPGVKAPKVPGFLKPSSKDSKKEEPEDDKTEEGEGNEDSSKSSKEKVKEILDKMPKISKPGFLKKEKKGEEEDETPAQEDGKSNQKGENEDKPDFFENIKTKASQMPVLLRGKKDAKKKVEPEEEESDREESKELLEDSSKNEDKRSKRTGSMKPAAMVVLESIRSAAHHVPAMFKKNKDSNLKDVEAGIKPDGNEEEQKELLEKSIGNNDNNKEGDDLEEIKINNDEDKDDIASHHSEKKDPEKPPLPVSQKGMDRVKDISQQYCQQFRELEMRRKIAVIAIIIGIIFLILVIAIAAASSPSGWTNEIRYINDGKHVETHTSCGTVIGVVEAPNQLRFSGIPYSAKKDIRFSQSNLANNLEECHPQDFVAYENSTIRCWRKTENGGIEGREDCLTLNIYTSSVVYNELMPVVVYVRGEDVSESIIPSTELAKNNSVVFVEVNYRLGVLGFLSNDVLSRKSYPHTSGNYGIGDVITALKWVKLNIQHFGGHPSKVTVFGTGVGATVVTAMTSSHLVHNLYNRVWVTNGAGSFANKTLEQVSQENDRIIKKLNCGSDKSRCLLNADAEVLTENIPYEWQEPSLSELPQNGDKEHSWIVVDKHILSHHPITYWREHQSDNDIPIVFGSTAHSDVTEDNYNIMDWTDRDTFEAHVEEKLGSFNVTLPELAMSLYNSSDNWIDYASMLSDIRTVCPIMNLAEIASINFNADVYSYVVTQPRSGVLGGISDSTSDVAAIFGLYEPRNETEVRFVHNMQDLFYGFVRKGSFSDENKDVALGYYEVSSEVTFQDEPRETCEFWEKANHIVPEYANLD